MSFSGKRYRRVKYENIHEILNAAKSPQNLDKLIKTTAPIFSFTKNTDGSYTFNVEVGDDKMTTQNFYLDEEHVQERLDGTKVKVKYSLESDNVLNQTITKPDGNIAFFKREFSDREAKMTISLPETHVTSCIYYELVD